MTMAKSYMEENLPAEKFLLIIGLPFQAFTQSKQYLTTRFILFKSYFQQKYHQK